MSHKKITMVQDKKIALVAHDNKKRDLLEWARFNSDLLAHHIIYATGTTGETLMQQLGLTIRTLQSNRLVPDYDEYRTRKIDWEEEQPQPQLLNATAPKL